MSSLCLGKAEKKPGVELSQPRWAQQTEPREHGGPGGGQRVQGGYGRRLGRKMGALELGPRARPWPRPLSRAAAPRIYCLPSGLGEWMFSLVGRTKGGEAKCIHSAKNVYQDRSTRKTRPPPSRCSRFKVGTGC